MSRYASETVVPVERSRAEIEECLKRYGATSFTSGWDEGSAMIAFRIRNLNVRFVLPIPSPKDAEYKRKLVRGHERMTTDAQKEKMCEQDIRQRWRALLLVVKAKLEAVECKIATLEQEFMAFIVLPNDETLGQWVARNAIEAIRRGEMPLALGPAKENGHSD